MKNYHVSVQQRDKPPFIKAIRFGDSCMFRLCVGEKKGIALESTNWFTCASSFTKKTCAKCSQGHCLLLSYSYSSLQTEFFYGRGIRQTAGFPTSPSVHRVTDLLHFLVEVFRLICVHIMPCPENGYGLHV